MEYIKSEIPKTVSCLIPDQPLTKFEGLAVGISTFGAFRGALREASLEINNGKLLLRAYKDASAGGGIVLVEMLFLKNVHEIKALPVDMKEQLRMVFKRSVIFFFGIMAFFMIIVFLGTHNAEVKYPEKGLRFGFRAAIAISFLFSFVPGIFKIKRNLTMVSFLTKEDKALLVALNPEQLEILTSLLKEYSLDIEGKNYRNPDIKLD